MSTGYNTYIVAALFGLTAFAHAMGWMTDDAFATINTLLTGGGLAFLRAGVKRETSK